MKISILVIIALLINFFYVWAYLLMGLYPVVKVLNKRDGLICRWADTSDFTILSICEKNTRTKRFFTQYLNLTRIPLFDFLLV